MPAASIAQFPSEAEQIEQARIRTLRELAVALEVAASALVVLADQAAARPAKQAAQPDEMLTVPEAARELRRSPAHVRSACRRGVIKAMKDGHGYRIRRSALAAYERRRTGA